MIIDYGDGTSVVLHLGDLNYNTTDQDMCWFKLNNEWVRSPFDTVSITLKYLLSLQSTNHIRFDDMPDEFKKHLR